MADKKPMGEKVGNKKVFLFIILYYKKYMNEKIP